MGQRETVFASRLRHPASQLVAYAGATVLVSALLIVTRASSAWLAVLIVPIPLIVIWRPSRLYWPMTVLLGGAYLVVNLSNHPTALASASRGSVAILATLVVVCETLFRNGRARQQAEADLKASEARYRLLAERVPDILYRFRLAPQPAFEYLSPAVQALTGYAPEEFYGEPALVYRLIHPDDLQQGQAASASHWPLGEPFVTRWVRKDGGVIWTEQHNTPIYTDDGQLVALEGVARDVTEREQARRQLEASESQMRAVLEALPIGVWILDVAGRIVLSNPAVRRIWGGARYVGPEQFGEYRGWWLANGQLIAAEEWAAARAIRIGETSLNEEIQIEAFDGARRIILNSAVPIRAADGRITGAVVVNEDITERKQTEAALQESERKYRGFVEQSAEAYVLINEQGRIVEWNPACERLTGLARADVLGRDYWDIHVQLFGAAGREPDYRERLRQAVLEALHTGRGAFLNQPLEATFLRPDGRERIARQWVFPIKTDTGFWLGSTATDITERKQAELELERQRDFALSVMSTMGQGLTVTDAQGRFEYINPAYAEFMGYRPENLIGKTPGDITHPDDLAALREARAQRQAGRTTTYETRLIRADGQLVDVLITGTPRWRGGQFDGAIAVVTDLTERKRAERRLAEERERLRALIATSRDGLLLVGADGQLQIFNERAVECLGLSGPAEVWLGQTLGQLITALRRRAPAAARLLLAEARRIFQAPETTGQGECEAPPRTLRWQALPVRSEGRFLGHVVTFHDITEERQVAALRADLTHTLVHDLRRPLTGAQAALQILALDGLDALTADQRQMLGLLENSLQRLQDLVNSLLEISRLESGQVPLEPGPLDVAALARSVAGELEPSLRQKRLRLTLIAPTELPRAWADGRLIQRVLENLLGNALKFSPAEGVIDLSVEADRTASLLQVTVSDSGPGIMTELQHQLFEKFVTGQVAGHGSGLGLAFCRLAVEAHGGRIWVESTPGSGARFIFTLPLRPSPSELTMREPQAG